MGAPLMVHCQPYNLGNTVVFKHFGNHVGDWEHAMIRFRDGKPEAMHLSAHSDGDAWKWDVFEKKGDRPVIYSASGSRTHSLSSLLSLSHRNRRCHVPEKGYP